METDHESRIGRRSGRLIINDLPGNSKWASFGLIAIIFILLCNVVFLHVRLHGLRQKVKSEPELFQKETPTSNEKLVDLKKKLSNIEDDTHKLKSNVGIIEAETNSLEDTVHEMSAKAEQMATNVGKLSNKSQNLERDIEKSKSSWNTLGKDVESLKAETFKNITGLMGNVEENNRKLINEMRVHQNTVRSVATAEKNLENRFAGHQSDFNRYKTDTNSKLAALKTISNSIFALRTTLTSVEEDSKKASKSLSMTQFDVQKGLRALNDKQNQLTSRIGQQRAELQASIANLEKLIKLPADELAKATSDYSKLMNDAKVLMSDGKNALKQMKHSEDTLRDEIEQAKAVVQGEALKNLSSHMKNTEGYLQTVVELMNANTQCGGKFIALPNTQKFQIAHLNADNVCTYTILAPSGKRIEYTLPEYSSSMSSKILFDDGKKWYYDGDVTNIRTKTTQSNTLVVTFSSTWRYRGQADLYITYKAV